MRNLLALAAAIVIVFLGLGWYLNWYQIKTTTTSDGHRQISIDVDTDRIKSDIGKARDRIGGDGSSTTPVTTPTPPGPTTTPIPKTTPGTTTSFPRNDSPWFFPGDSWTPAPPTGGAPMLPPPR